MISQALSFGAKLLFGILAKANKERVRWGVEYLSRRMKCTSRETRRRISELKDNNLIIVLPRKGRVNDYIINLELISMIQTPDRLVRGGDDHNGQGRDDHRGQGNSKEHSIKETPKGGEQGSPISELRKYFTERCKKMRGYEPEMAFGKEGKMLKEKLQRYNVERIKDLINKFVGSRVADELGCTLAICLSAGIINQWLAGKLERKQKPYYRGNQMCQMRGRWMVSENGEWLEFAGKQSEIEWR